MAIPSITELTLLKALWKQQPLSTREIHERVEEELAWTYSSTRKTLERMLEKGMISQHSAHGMNVYAPVLEKVETLAAFAHDFSHRVMEMNAPLPVNMFTGSKLVNQHELKELEQLLSEWPEEKE
ncbi:BlaI/MecI/CopY family transcriptional regulator [Pseudoduganella violaceinigra]|uniref:BlaI/MecI/CopY family transcriptional regulator n=1 Tax=Pseudoduganella violaceinigra TaxID=246602 RepID=UPI000408668B|nr:BlaI/MecI/CopY family transcriptional regulator [Pseudoduganella violaceinigra]